jgi:hypothetical protein
MSDQLTASILSREKCPDDKGYVMLARDTRDGREIWVHKTLDGIYHPYPRRMFTTITDFRDWIMYQLPERVGAYNHAR